MDNEQLHTFALEFVVSLLRKIIFSAGAFLLGHNILTQGQIDRFTTDDILAYLGGLVLIGISIAWQWAKIKFNRKTAYVASDTPAEVTVAQAQKEVLKTTNFVSSV